MPLFTLPITFNGAVQQVSATSVPCKQIIVQTNASNCAVGDKNVSSTRGAQLMGGSPGGSVNFGPFTGNSVDLNEIYVLGINAATGTVIYVT